MRGWMLALLVIAGLGPAQVLAGTTVEVLDTFPRGSSVTLDRNQNYYLRIGYQSDETVRIWARPYFRGQPVQAGTNPSGLYAGSGEMLGWFFMMQPGDEVDEIRIRAGDGSENGTQAVASYRVHIVAADQPAAPHAEPAWVVDLKQRAAAEQQADYERRMSEPVSPGTTALMAVFVFVVLGAGIAGIGLPILAMRRWHGSWRVAAAVPLVVMAFVLLRIVFGAMRDPTSHNLWPFEILQVAALSLVTMAALWFARKFVRQEVGSNQR